MSARHLIEILRRDLAAGPELVRPAGGHLAVQHVAHALIQVILENALLVEEVLPACAAKEDHSASFAGGAHELRRAGN